MVKYDWMDTKVVATLSFFITKSTVDVVGTVVGDPMDWSVLPLVLEKKICSYFEDCVIPL